MAQEITKLDNTTPEEIFLIDGRWKISKVTAKAINDLLKPLANQ
jgi:hypothetical protein